jgi:hypothetical protein
VCRHDLGTIRCTPIAVLRLSRDPSEPDLIYDARGADRSGRSRCCGPHRGGSEAAATRPEAHSVAPARAGRAANLQVSPHRSASSGTDAPRCGSCAPWIGPASTSHCKRSSVPACVAEPVPCLGAPTVVVCLDVGLDGAGAPTGGLEAAPTRPEAHGAAPARASCATNLGSGISSAAPATRPSSPLFAMTSRGERCRVRGGHKSGNRLPNSTCTKSSLD